MEKYDKLFLEIAKTIAKQSHCVSFKTGAVIVKDNRIISTGWNGTLCGYTNCDQVFNPYSFEREAHHNWANTFELHAELNAILMCAKSGISCKDTTLYCTLQPCITCLKYIIQAGITRIVYDKIYDKTTWDKDLLEYINKMGIRIEQLVIS